MSISADGVSVGAQELQQKYATLAASLRATYKALAGAGAVPYAGGIDWPPASDPSVKPLSFGKGMHDNLRAGQQDYAGRGEIPEWPDGGFFEGG